MRRALISRIGMLAVLVIMGGCSLRSVTGHTATPTPSGGACLHAATAPNVRVSHDTYLAHSEPMLAVNPHNPLNLVGGSKFFTDPKNYRFQIGMYASHDGGCTWHDSGVLPGFATATTSDISVAFDDHNGVYAAVLNTDLGEQSGISIAKSTDGGDTFGPPITVYNDRNGLAFSDKPWLAIDTTGGPHAGAIYVVWSYDPNKPPCGVVGHVPCNQELAFARSTDGGLTFSKIQFIEGSAPYCTYAVPGRAKDAHLCDGVLGAIPTILPDGTLAVAYSYQGDQQPTKLLVVTSHDGGTTWGGPTLVATANDSPYVFPPANFRNTTLPAFVADPTTGQLYLAWTEEQNNEAQIVLARSTDAGQTWSAPVRVNDDPAGRGAIHIQPQLAVAPDGVVSVMFFDSRVSLTPHLLDVFVAQSIDHGQSFLPNVRVTSQSWDTSVDEPKDHEHEGGNGFIGDYQGLAATNDFVYPFWNDTRTGAQEIFTAAIPSARP